MKNYNYGWAILRMCFEVVTDHLWYRENGISNIGSWLVYLHGSVAVPVFMLLAFVLSYDKLQSDSKEKYVERLQRILLPHIAWSVIYYLIYELVDFVLKENRVTPHDLNVQLMTGSSVVINGAMWFQVVLFLSTAFYMVCYHLFKEKALNISIILGIVALIIQYTGINGRMWKWLPWEYELTLARLVEMLPYVSTGMLIGKNISKLQETRDKFSRKRRMLLTITLCIFEVIIGESRRYHIVDVGGYSYSGVLLIVRAILLVIAFYLLPIDMKSGKKKRLICVCTAYTLGIYCLHNCVGLISYTAIEWLGYNREMYSMVKSICVYAFCYFLSWLIAHLPWKWCRKLVE